MIKQQGADRLPWINSGLVVSIRLVVDVLCVVLMLYAGYLFTVVRAGYDRTIADMQRRDAALEARVERLEAGGHSH